MNIEVTLWPVCDRLAVLTQAYCRTIVYACWDFELYGLRAPLGAFAMAHATDLLWYFAFAMARRADNSLLYIAKDRAHRLYDLAIAIAFFTCFEFVTRLGCCTFAMTTGIVECEAQICFCAKYGVFKADLYARLDVITAGLLLSATACATAKKATKYIPEAHVPKVKVYILAAPLAAKSTKRIAAAASTTPRTTPSAGSLYFSVFIKNSYHVRIQLYYILYVYYYSWPKEMFYCQNYNECHLSLHPLDQVQIYIEVLIHHGNFFCKVLMCTQN
jgi:hypothetical protein